MRPLAPIPACLLALLLALAAAPAAAEDVEILPLSDVRPGMRGVVRTVLHGTRLEEFEIEVVDVMRHYLVKQDVILVRCLGERMQHLGIARGMSGSPVYIDGKLVGALSYTWPWAKEPLGGVTPIETMIADGSRPLEGRASGAEPSTPLRSPPPRSPRAKPITDAGQALEPIGTPVCVGGFSAEGQAALFEVMEDLGHTMQPVGGGLVAGAPAGWAHLDAPVVPGAALCVDLLRGDFSIAAIGTCTHVDGNKAYAFGHSYEHVGETLWPVSVGYVYAVMPSQNMSFKLGSSIRDVGALVQDRQSGIVVELGRKAPMVPFEVTLRNAVTERSEAFAFEVTANRIYFQPLMVAALREAFGKAERTLGANTKKYVLTVKLEGLEEPWTYEDTIVGFDPGFSRLLLGLVDAASIHPTQRAAFEWVKLDVEIENVDRRAMIESVTASQDEVRPGEEIELLVRLRHKEGGALTYERLRVRIPPDARAGNLGIQVVGGDNVPAELASPVDLAEFGKLYDAFYKATELVAVVPTGRVDLDMGGRLYRSIPLSALPRIARSGDATKPRITPVTTKVRRPVPYVVWASGRVVVRVLP